MRLLIALSLALFLSCASGEFTKDGDVYVLTDSNFEDFLKEYPTVLVGKIYTFERFLLQETSTLSLKIGVPEIFYTIWNKSRLKV
jgi:hypothetical protein